MRIDQLVFLQAAKALEGGLGEALSLLSFTQAWNENVSMLPSKSKEVQLFEDKSLQAGQALQELIEDENPEPKRKANAIDPNSTRRRVWSAIETILTRDGEQKLYNLFDGINKIHPDLPWEKIVNNAKKMPGVIRQKGNWSLSVSKAV